MESKLIIIIMLFLTYILILEIVSDRYPYLISHGSELIKNYPYIA